MRYKDPYAYPWRANHELIAASCWFASSAFLTGAAIAGAAPLEILKPMAASSLAMGCLRLPAGLALKEAKDSLKGAPISFINHEKMLEDCRNHPGQIILGKGFFWERVHAQRIHEIQKLRLDATCSAEPGEIGSRYIHGVGGKDRLITLPIAHADGHTLIVGTTGAGKTRCFDLLIAQAICRNEAVIIIDPKGDRELRANAKKACELAGRPDRFAFFHPGFPEESVRINPLRNFSRGTELASRIGTLIPSKAGGDSFKAFGEMALNGVIHGLLATGKRPTIRAIKRCLESGLADLVSDAVLAAARKQKTEGAEWIAQLAAMPRGNTKAKFAAEHYRRDLKPDSDLGGLIALQEHDPNHFSKMIASLMPVLSQLASSELGELLSYEGKPKEGMIVTDSAKIIKNAQVLYIGLDSLTDPSVSASLGSLMLADLAAVAGDRYNYGAGEGKVNIFIDEAAEVVNEPFVQLLNKGRGAGMRCVVATQTFADFEAKTGSPARARQILANVNNLLSLRVLDAETQKYVTDSLPKTRIEYSSRSEAVTVDAENPFLCSGNSGEKLIEEECELFLPQLLGQLPNLEYIAKLSGGKIIKGRLPILCAKDECVPQTTGMTGARNLFYGAAHAVLSKIRTYFAEPDESEHSDKENWEASSRGENDNARQKNKTDEDEELAKIMKGYEEERY